MGKSAKGSAFEREFCKDLSLWWTLGKRDDVFWRTGGSGGRAKSRGRKGRDTYGQHGDIAATDPIGDPLIDLLTIELKRGYSRTTVADLLDKPSHAAQQEWEKWVCQVTESHEQSGSFSWMMVQRRDKRVPVVFFPDVLFQEVEWYLGGIPVLSIEASIRCEGKRYKDSRVYGTTLGNWFDTVPVSCLRQLAKEV